MLASLQVQDGPRDLGTISFSLPLGTSNSVSENFDSVSVPALPGGWTTGSTGAASGWTSTNDAAASGTISAFASGAEGTGVSEINSPVFSAPTTQARLSFRHAFNLESYSPGTGLDGAVLEMAIDGGPFADVIDAGETFVCAVSIIA